MNTSWSQCRRWGAVAVVAIGMIDVGFAAMPLYRLFRAASGYGGTPSIGVATAPRANDQSIRVRLNADTSSCLNPKGN